MTRSAFKHIILNPPGTPEGEGRSTHSAIRSCWCDDGGGVVEVAILHGPWRWACSKGPFAEVVVVVAVAALLRLSMTVANEGAPEGCRTVEEEQE